MLEACSRLALIEGQKENKKRKMKGEKRLQKTKKNGTLIAAVIIPACLLTVFILTRQEPPTPEIITLEAVSWNMSRPANYIIIDQWVNNSYAESVTFADFTVHVVEYEENAVFWEDFDGMELMVFANVTVPEGSVTSVVVNFTGVDGCAAVDICEDPDPEFAELVNLKLVSIRDWDCAFGKDSKITATAIGQPRHVYLRFLVRWMFIDENDLDHWVTVTSEVTYFNGTAHETVVMPIQLGVSIG